MEVSVSVIAKMLGVKGVHFDRVNMVPVLEHRDGQEHIKYEIHVEAAPYKRLQRRCPICDKKCPEYDVKYDKPPRYRAPNLNGLPVYLLYTPHRIICEEHGVHTEARPWVDGNTRFTASFNNEIAFQAMFCPKTAISEFFGVNWRSVESCIEAVHQRLEPDIKRRLIGLTRFCIDETSYKKGHNYMTVITDPETNTVVWLHDGYGDKVFEQFALMLTPEQRAAITIIAGDGAKWIDRIAAQYFPNAHRCIDPFHAVGWATEALDETRRTLSAAARRQLNQERAEIEHEAECRRIEYEKEYAAYCEAKETLSHIPHHRGPRSRKELELLEVVNHFEHQYNEAIDLLNKRKRARLTEEEAARLSELEKKADCIQGCKYAMGMVPEKLSQMNQDRLELLKVNNPEAYEAYRLKEAFRIIVHMKDEKQAWEELKKWIYEAATSPFEAFRKLAAKIFRHRHSLMNSIRYSENSSQSEQINGVIKGLIHRANGFKSLDAMFALIYLKCSDLVIPLDNRYRPTPDIMRQRREKARAQRHRREEARRAKANVLTA